jgi:osmotically-inducible protein OsmY
MKRTQFIFVSSAILGIIGMSASTFAQGPYSAVSPQTMSSGASAGQPSDSTLSKEVKRALGQDPLTKSSNIQVTTEDRMVILSGEVASKRVEQRAEQLASQVNGVKGIENHTQYSNQ